MDITIAFKNDPDIDGDDDTMLLSGVGFEDLNQLMAFWLRATQACGYTYIDVLEAKSLGKKSIGDKTWVTGW